MDVKDGRLDRYRGRFAIVPLTRTVNASEMQLSKRDPSSQRRVVAIDESLDDSSIHRSIDPSIVNCQIRAGCRSRCICENTRPSSRDVDREHGICKIARLRDCEIARLRAGLLGHMFSSFVNVTAVQNERQPRNTATIRPEALVEMDQERALREAAVAVGVFG